jgi:hypothetical protein
MTTPTPHPLHNAHYHPNKVTAAWAAFVAAVGGEAKAVATRRAQREAQRRRETTYARGVEGKA